MTTDYWCEWAWLGGMVPMEGVVVRVDGDRIRSMETGVLAPPSRARRLPGFTIPGMANAHSHAFHRALRGRTHFGRGTFWTWRQSMYEAAAALTPELYCDLATAVYAEMALAGITTVGEFHYLHDGANEMGDALVEAARRAGVRLTLLDTCYLHGGIGADRSGVQARFGDASVDAWLNRASMRPDEPNLRVGAAIHSVRAVSPLEATRVANWAADRGAPLHAHVSEQRAENEACLEAFGRTPTQVLADAGAVTKRFTAVHATHLTDGDIGLLGDAEAHACFCPTTERDLADGIGPARALDAGGVRLCVGSDSHAVIDLFEEARAIELDERLATGQRGGHDPSMLLRAATRHGTASLGWPDAGALDPGQRADLVTVSLDSVRMAGIPPEDLVPGVVFAATAADVSGVIVDGRPVVVKGKHQTVPDVAGALRASISALGDFDLLPIPSEQ